MLDSIRGNLELSVQSDDWNTIWLVKKALYESDKRKVPVKIEVRSGSVESTISLLADLAQMGAFAFAIVVYIHSRKKKDKPLRITGFNRDWAYAYASHHLKTKALAPEAKLVEERQTSEGGYFFKFEDSFGNIHNFTIARDFNVEYYRSTQTNQG